MKHKKNRQLVAVSYQGCGPYSSFSFIFFRAVHASGQTSRAGSGRVGSADPTRPDPRYIEKLLTRPDPTRDILKLLDPTRPDPTRPDPTREI